MPLVQAQVLGIFAFVALAVIGAAPYALIWGSPAEGSRPGGFLILAMTFGGIVVHEMLHGAGYKWGGADPADVEYGIKWSSLTPYAHCAAPLRCGSYRWAIALPGLVLGVVPCLGGAAVGSWTTVVFGILMLGAAGGDAMLLWMLRDVSSDAWVRDHPNKMGSLVLGRGASEVPPALDFELGSSDQSESEDTGSDRSSSLKWGLLLIALGLILAAAIAGAL
jgi:hypothetical protein